MTAKEDTTIEARAKAIAQAILDTDTDCRGELLRQVATHMRNHTQFFTAALFQHMADTHGYPKLPGKCHE